MPRPAEPEIREALLERCFAAAQTAGSTEVTLAWLAAATGTSARMLVYHFGSREGLEAALAARLEAELRARFAGFRIPPRAGEHGVVLALWDFVSAPGMRGLLALGMDVMRRARRGDAAAAALAEREREAWSALLSERIPDPDEALALLFLFVGAVEDLLATGDPARGRRAIRAHYGRGP